MNRRKAKKIFLQECKGRTNLSCVTVAKACTLIMKVKVSPKVVKNHRHKWERLGFTYFLGFTNHWQDYFQKFKVTRTW